MNEYDNNTPDARESTSGTGTPAIMRTIFSIIMVIVYVGMGVLLLINYFDWEGDWLWLRWIGGVVLVIYGLWRAYRQAKGIDSYTDE